MKITYSAKKIIKNQRFIFRALPVLFVGLFILTACGGGALLNKLEQTQNDLEQQARNISGSFGDLDDNNNGNGNGNGNDKFTPAADPDLNKVAYSDWVRVYNPVEKADTTNQRNQFLQTRNKDISTSGPGSYRILFNLNTAVFNDLYINGDGDDGFAYFTKASSEASSPSKYYEYAGIYDTTDLGAPLKQTSGSLMWNGVIGLRDSAYPTEFTITFTDTGGKIDAFVLDIIGSFDFLVAGTFDASGVIAGNIHYAKFTDDNTPVPPSILNGTLSGLIGSGGAVAVFHSLQSLDDGYVGGFIASPNVGNNDDNKPPPAADPDPDKVDYSDWVRVHNPGASLNLREPRRQFLQTRNKDISTFGIKEVSKYNLNLNTTEFEGRTIGGDANDGVVFFDGLGSLAYYYAGIFDTTDLGAPLTQTSGSLMWNGVISIYSHETEFKITFTDAGGKIDAFVRDIFSTLDFLVEGTFDTSGVITGNVHYAEFDNDDNPVLPPIPNGTLSGLIGQEGAVGAFYSRLISSRYSGGFIAGPKVGFDQHPNRVTYRDWARVQDPEDMPDKRSPRNQFLETTNKAISTEGTTPSRRFGFSISPAQFDGIAMGVDSNDGVVFFQGDIDSTSYYYAGIYDSTDLGAPLIQTDGSLMWNGVVSISSAIQGSAEFTITFTGTGGKIDAFAKNIYIASDLLIAGTFDTGGVVTGNIHYAEFADDNNPVPPSTFNGTLSGLIGQEGTVGAFYNDGYAGGFIAGPNVGIDRDPSKVTYNDWVRVYNPDAAANTNYPRSNFLQTSDKDIDTGRISRPSKYSFNLIPPYIDDTAMGVDADDGFAYYYWGESLYYAGIYDSTDLGAPLTQTDGSLMWSGVINIDNNRKSTKFTIAFTGKGGTISAFAPDIYNANDLLIAGTFDTGGVITGNTHFDSFTDNLKTSIADPNGRLSGLIGQEGAVAVFHAQKGTINYVGGFIAGPNVGVDQDTDKVKYSDWARVYNPNIMPDTNNRRGQFLQTKGKSIKSSGTNNSSYSRLTLVVPEFEYIGIDGDADDGFVSFYWGRSSSSGTRYGYAGIYESTDLGAPLPSSSPSLRWNGAILINGDKDFTEFKITLNSGGGTIDAVSPDVFRFAPSRSSRGFLIDGTFNTSGVISGKTYLGSLPSSGLPANSAFNGILSGIIGQEGAVGVFYGGGSSSYSGGFVAAPTPAGDQDSNKVTYSDWVRAYNPNVVPNRDNRQNQFLQTTKKKIYTEEGNTFSLNLRTTEFEGTAINGDYRDGFASSYWRPSPSSPLYRYVGLFDSTDLGAPVTETSGNILWSGVIGWRGFTQISTEFTITFTVTGGKIDAFVKDVSLEKDLLIAGRFNTGGVITGNVHLEAFRNEITPVAPSTPNGRLSGLIGQRGAVAVFYGSDYTGGFISSPTVGDGARPAGVNAYDWESSFRPIPLNLHPGGRNKFLKIEGKMINDGGASNTRMMDFSDFTDDSGTSLGLDADDGLAYFSNRGYSNSHVPYAGIFGTTSLGMPIAETDFSATWAGKLGVIASRTYTGKADFNLDVTFNGTTGTLDAFLVDIIWRSSEVRARSEILIKGTFDANGLITGWTHLAEFGGNVLGGRVSPFDGGNGILSGIIGSDGAVGVFLEESGDVGYSGGFIASPNAAELPEMLRNVTGPKWTYSFKGNLGRARSADNQFLEFDADVIFLETSNVYRAADKSYPRKPIPINLNMRDATFGSPAVALGGDAADALAFGSGFYESSSRVSQGRSFFAGINSDTYLGKELPTWQSGQIVSAAWNGQFRAESGFGTTTNTDFALEVDFENRRVEAFVPIATASTTYYYLKGSFPADLDGAMVGTVARRQFPNGRMLITGTNGTGVLTGLIGQEGAVGVFISGRRTDTSNTLRDGGGDWGYVGGFVANQNLGVNRITTDGWTQSFDSPLNSDPTAGNQFLQIAEKTISIGNATNQAVGGDDPAVRTLDFTAFSSDIPLGLDANDGLAYFVGYIGGTRYTYAGIYGNTDLGLPIIDNIANATWAGKFQVDGGSKVDFDLTVTFDGTAGTAGAFFVDIVQDYDFLIEGAFDKNGVITGKTHYAKFTGNLQTATNVRNGTLSGIIGRDGAVGVFHGVVSRLPYVGGFIAAPPQ